MSNDKNLSQKTSEVDHSEINFIIRKVRTGSEAHKVGIRKGDILIEYNDQEISGDVSNFLQLVSQTKLKDKVNIKVLRYNKYLIFNVSSENPGIIVASQKQVTSIINIILGIILVLISLGLIPKFLYSLNEESINTGFVIGEFAAILLFFVWGIKLVKNKKTKLRTILS